MPTADEGAEPGECGWTASADAKGVDGTDEHYQLVVQSLRQAVDAASITVDTAVAAIGEKHLPAGFVTSEPTLLLTRDGTVVARDEVGDGGLASPDQAVDGDALVTEVATNGIDPVACGPESAALPDGTYQVWAIETVDGAQGDKVTLLGGGQDVEIASGAPVSLCGADADALPQGTDEAKLTAHASYEAPDVDPATHPKKRLSAGLTIDNHGDTIDGAFASSIYLVDGDGRIVVDGTVPAHRSSGGIQAIALGADGGGDGRAWEEPATACKDGKKLTAGTYRAYVDLAVDRAGGRPGVVHLVAEAKEKIVIP
ncbi:hypothetical protein [Cellulomonas sp. PhB150]|uniref:hypothetical protein n=1 Tax=Cellulomonas sp. PhB150 TaxID=2485188 RepID=UPI000FB1D53E|nr:hypothetical protein [Cellulomonas sp. PhB150]ROS23131.1 hypothetical protein EDF34_3307 [Cellulomonas sp. PhB150]